MTVERFKNNPIIRPADVKPARDDFEVVGAFNPGATVYNNETLLLLRVAERPKDKSENELVAPILKPDTGQIQLMRIPADDPEVEVPDARVFHYKNQTFLTSISHLRIARSTDGINFTVDQKPWVLPENAYETYGLEDPRITYIDGKYMITYKMVSDKGIATGLLETQDFKTYQRRGMIFCPENIDVVLFPRKINGMYYALTRPVVHNIGQLCIWIACSPDMIHWGGHQCLIEPRAGSYDNGRVGGSCVPIETENGWLEIYHAADKANRYCLAACLLDRENPAKVLAYSSEPIMQPEADYELNGFFGNVVFSCGATVENGQITIYYGASDCVTAGCRLDIDTIEWRKP
jgi:beta-1,2-mannobiose phosphorylase / 1,2-beta-oligomannan phosphorylase